MTSRYGGLSVRSTFDVVVVWLAVMSLGSRKRPLTLEGESRNTKETKEKKCATAARPPRPAKRRKTADSSEQHKSQVLESKVTGKVKRQAWSKAAINAFYEGLLQHGKEFQKILKYMQSKQKKLNDPTIGNLTKDQVRFFYYRNWHKVESLLTSPAHSQPTETKKSTKVSTPPSTEPPVIPFDVPGEVGQAVLDDHAEGDPENPLDSSMEEVENAPSPIKPTEQDNKYKGSPSPAECEIVEKSKEQVQSSPGSATTTDSLKVEGKVKDTVVVNGVKQSLDLVALICYNKLRKKCLGDHNIGKRLSELVFQGATSIPGRFKGKRKAQIKIPNCGAFRGPIRKTEPVSDDHTIEPVDSARENTMDSCLTGDSTNKYAPTGPELKTTTPNEVIIELRPLTSATWLYVQGLSQNPRVRLRVDVSSNVSTVHDYLSLKWKVKEIGTLKFCTMEGVHSVRTPKPELTSVSLPATPENRPVLDIGSSSLTHRICRSVPATPTAVCTTTLQPEHTVAVGDGIVETAKSDCSNQLNTIVDGANPCVPSSDWKKINGFNQCLQDSEIELSLTWKELYHKFGNSRGVQLLYEITKIEQTPNNQYGSLRAAIKLVEFFTRKPTTEMPQNPVFLTPIKKPAVITHCSPKVVEYMQTLSRRSPQKSPLSKYRRLKARSPLKRVTTPRHNFKRIQLTFDGTNTVGAISESPTPPVSAPQPSVLQSSPMSTRASASPTVLNTLKISDKTPRVVQLTSPERSLVALPKTSIGSFADMKVQSLLATAKEIDFRVHNETESKSHASGTGQTVSTSCASIGIGAASVVQSDPSVSGVSSVSSLDRTLASLVQVTASGAVLGRDVPQNQLNVLARMPPVVHLKPGVHRIQPSQTVPSTTRPSQCISLTMPSMGVPLMPKATPLGDKLEGTSSATVMPIVSTLKPFGKPKRVKKRPTKPGQPHQLVPRPLPFLRGVNFGPNPTLITQSEPGDASTTTTQATPAANQASLSTSPLSSVDPVTRSRHSSPRKTTAALIQNQHIMLQLLQSYLLQQQQKQLGKSTANNSVSSSQVASSSVEPHATLATPLNTAVSVNPTPYVVPSTLGLPLQPESSIPEEEIQSTVLDNFFAERPVCYSSSESKHFNTSSDTVNKLLRGLSSMKPSESIQKLSEETSDVLPTFAKALGQSFLSPEGRCGGQVDSDGISSRERTDGLEKDNQEVDQVGQKTETPVSEDSQLSFLNDISSTSLSGILGTLTDTNFKQVADNGDVFEHIDFDDMFSQLKDVLSPEKGKSGGPRGVDQTIKQHDQDESQSSIGDLIDYVNCPSETSKNTTQPAPSSSYSAPVDPACRSFLEENSVDFVQKFKELASTMNKHTSRD